MAVKLAPALHFQPTEEKVSMAPSEDKGLEVEVRLVGSQKKVEKIRAIIFSPANPKGTSLGVFRAPWNWVRVCGRHVDNLETYVLFIPKELLAFTQKESVAEYDSVYQFLRRQIAYGGKIDPLLEAIDPDAISILATLVRTCQEKRVQTAYIAELGGISYTQERGVVFTNANHILFKSIISSNNNLGLRIGNIVDGELSAEEKDLFSDAITKLGWVKERKIYYDHTRKVIVCVMGNAMYLTHAIRDKLLGEGASAKFYPCIRLIFNTGQPVERTIVAHGIDGSASGLSLDGRDEAKIEAYFKDLTKTISWAEDATRLGAAGLPRVYGFMRHGFVAEDKDLLGFSLYTEKFEHTLENCCFHPDFQKNKYKLALQIVKGLWYIHCSGRVHRDIKPSNIMLNTELLKAVIIDLSEMVDRGTLQGSPAFMPKKFFKGPDEHDAYHLRGPGEIQLEDYRRCDLFGLAVVLIFIENPKLLEDFLGAARPRAFLLIDEWCKDPSVQSSPMNPVIQMCIKGDADIGTILAQARKEFHPPKEAVVEPDEKG